MFSVVEIITNVIDSRRESWYKISGRCRDRSFWDIVNYKEDGRKPVLGMQAVIIGGRASEESWRHSGIVAILVLSPGSATAA